MADLRKLKDKAAELVSKGKFEKAASVYREVVEADAKDVATRQKLAEALRRAGEIPDAIEEYKQVADRFARDGLLIKAIAICKTILELDPEHGETQQALADLYSRRQASDAARPPVRQTLMMAAAVKPAAPAVPAAPAAGDERSVSIKLGPAVPPAVPPPIPPRQTGSFKAIVPPPPAPMTPPAPVDDPFALGPSAPADEPIALDEITLPEPEAITLGGNELSHDAGATAMAQIVGAAELAIEEGIVEELVLDEVIEPLPEPASQASAEPEIGIEIEPEVGIEIEPEEPAPAPAPPPRAAPPPAVPIFRPPPPAPAPARPAAARPPPPPPPAPAAPGLPQIPIFSDLGRDAFVALMDGMVLHRVGEGDSVLREGETGTSFFVIASGKFAVTKRDDRGEAILLAHLGEGDFFGEMALLSGSPRAATVSAEADSEVLEFKPDVLVAIARQHPQLAQSIRRFYRQRLLANAMATSPVFRPFAAADRKVIMSRFVARETKPGEVIVRESEPSDGLYVILEGAVDILKRQAGKDVLVSQLREGDLFGEMSCLRKIPATATVAVRRPGTLLKLPRKTFDELVVAFPQILELVSDLSSERTENLDAILSGHAEWTDEGLVLT
jgi:CRP-like cAMP-binding protein